jgi:RNA polymerase sigma-70 factor (ECF subfamily)
MYVIDGFSHREIAKELNIQEASSRSQLFKAKDFLQKRINPNT